MNGRSRLVGRHDDAGITLAETVVSVLAGSIVLAAAAALFVPAAQNADRTRLASANLTVATAASTQLQRQIRDATMATTSLSGTKLALCTYRTASSTNRENLVWKFETVSGGANLTAGAVQLGDAKTFSSVLFGSATDTTLVQGTPLTTTLVTGSAGHVPSSTLSITASPRSPQKPPGSTCS